MVEKMQLEANSYIINQSIGEDSLELEDSSELIEHLQSKQIIGEEIGEGSGEYQINIEKLLGTPQKYGKGIATETEKKDVYMLEKENTSTGSLKNVKFASITPIKIATTDNIVTYKIAYYRNDGEKISLGDLAKVKELPKTSNLIKFTIIGREYQAEKEMTWAEWVESEYNSEGYWHNSGSRIMNSNGEFITTDGTWDGSVGPNSKIEERAYTTKNVAECVYPNSAILVNTYGATKLAKDIKENNEIAYYDFNANTVKIGKVSKVYIHKNATNFVKYTFEDESYLEATDYHPIYTKEGWKSLTNRNSYETPQIGDEVKTEEGWKKVTKIETYTGKEDCYDFEITSKDGIKVNNYFANGTLVQGSY